tara:strand:- start:420 stop:815 length:396 start_codon:yes stop_codon:yes gene_type:complete
MTDVDGRYLKPFEALQLGPGDTLIETIGAVEGAVPERTLSVQTLVVIENLLVLKVTRVKDLIDNLHKHDDHESVATLISGRLRNVIDGKEFIAEPGATWRHPPGVVHSSEALEDCVQIEIKTPPRKTWVTV